MHLLNNRFLICFLLLLIHSINIYSQQYPITHYTKERGLPGNQVWCIYQDSKGYMWFATSVGLIKYNGKEYTFFDKKEGITGEAQ